METSEVLQKYDAALAMLMQHDAYLLERGLGEESISFRLAFYLQQEFEDYHVDCEYNGDAGKPNDIKALTIAAARMKEIGMKVNDLNNYRLSPDIIVHRRGNNDHNLLVIEIKKDTNLKKYKDYDLIKLEHLTVDFLNNHYNYQLGLFVEFNTGDQPVIAKELYFQEGIMRDERNRLK